MLRISYIDLITFNLKIISLHHTVITNPQTAKPYVFLVTLELWSELYNINRRKNQVASWKFKLVNTQISRMQQSVPTPNIF